MRIRNLIRGFALVLAVTPPARAAAQAIKVTLLGTGNPNPTMARFGPSTLVEAGGQTLLFDAGRGALQRLTQVHVPWQSVDGVFFTHLHSDHVVGFPDLWLTGWLVSGGRQRPVHVWGPVGTRAMMTHLTEAYVFDLGIRQAGNRSDSAGTELIAEEIAEGVVYEHDGVRVTAFAVDHGEVRPAFGYRIDYQGHAVVLSGDTRPTPNLIRYAQGADLLVHEVVSPAAMARSGRDPAQAAAVISYHTTAEQAGRIFAETKPKLAVYSHIGPPSATTEDLIGPARATYAGPLEVGEDLMVIEIDSTVRVRRPEPNSSR
ncbi:MAG: MBL fold metallo-hydrolase [Gemmatimonadota bacterium]